MVAPAGERPARERTRRKRERPRRERERTPQDQERAAQPADNEHVESVVSTVRRMLELSGLRLEVEGRAVEEGIELQLDGADRKLLRQRDGELHSALQFLLNRMARRAWPGAGRITRPYR